MKNRIRRQIAGFKPGYPQLPEPLENSEKTLTKIAILDCDNGGRVVTTERYDKNQRSWQHNIYQVRPDDNLMDIIATVLVEARLK